MKPKKPKVEAKRIIAAAIAMFIALIMVLGMLAPVFASPTANVTIEDAQIGYGRMYRMSGYTPFRVRLANDVEGDFTGILRIMVDVSHIMSERSFVSYSSEVFLPAGSSQDVEIAVPLNVMRRTHRAVLEDRGGQIVASRTMFASAVDSSLVMAGMLTANPRDASRLRWLQLDDNHGFEPSRILNERLIFLDETSFPTDIRTINNFNLIIIDNFDISLLSESNLGTLTEWVEAGGTLVLGGNRNSEHLRHLLAGVTSSPYHTYGLETIYDIRALTHITPRGEGTVIVHLFNLTAEPFVTLEGAEAFLSEIYRSVMSPIPEDPDRFITNDLILLTNNLPSFNDNTLISIVSIVGLYALAIASVLYFVLKKRDRREAAIYLIPVAAVGVTAIVAVIGLGSGYQAPISNTITRIDLDSPSGSATAMSFTGIHSPTSGDVEVRLSGGDSIRFEALHPWAVPFRGAGFNTGMLSSIFRQPHMHTPASARITEHNRADILVGTLSGELNSPNITYFNNASWSPNHFSQSADVQIGGSLSGEFSFEESVLVGTLHNGTELDLVDVIVFIGNNVERHETLPSGGTIQFRKELQEASHVSIWNMVDSAFPFHGINHNLSPQEGRDLHFRREILSALATGGTSFRRSFGVSGSAVVVYPPAPYVFVPQPDETYNGLRAEPMQGAITRHEAGDPISIRVMAYNFDDIIDMNIHVGGAPATSLHTNFLTTDMPISLGTSRSFDIPTGILGFSAIESNVRFHYSPFSSDFSTSDPGFMDFIYYLEPNVDMIQISWDTHMSNHLTKTIYNHYTGEWEPLRRTEYADDLDNYVRDGELRLRIDFQAHSWFQSPGIRIAGGRS